MIKHEIAIRRAPGLPPLRELDAGWQLLLNGLARFRATCRRAGFDPDQPRVPAGNPDGGQWTSGGGAGRNDPRVVSDATPDSDWKPGAQYAQNDPSHPGGRAGIGHNQGPPLDKPPAVPQQRPPTAQQRNDFLKAAARWIVAAVRANRSVSPFVAAYEAMSWLDTERPFIESYQDPPKTLEELQRAVSDPKPGYHNHHVVEKGPAAKENFPNSMINSPENIMRIPVIKHWEITGWFGRPNKDFGGLAPRGYLREKPWSERVGVGRYVLVKHGVLKP